jgi:hypothetical protein
VARVSKRADSAVQNTKKNEGMCGAVVYLLGGVGLVLLGRLLLASLFTRPSGRFGLLPCLRLPLIFSWALLLPFLVVASSLFFFSGFFLFFCNHLLLLFGRWGLATEFALAIELKGDHIGGGLAICDGVHLVCQLVRHLHLGCQCRLHLLWCLGHLPPRAVRARSIHFF